MMAARATERPGRAATGHVPVMLSDMLAVLAPAAGERLVDATFGGGGYSRAILAAAECAVLGIDRDLEAIRRAEALAAESARFIPVLGRFGELDALARAVGWETADGVVLDIGVSSFQLDTAARGFSFQQDGPLDMRMGGAGPTAADVVNRMNERELADVIFRLGEERQSRRIARAIVQRRSQRPFTSTAELAGVIETALGGRRGARIHPATLTFQALRMYVNDELGELARGLAAAERLLRPGGRLVVVTFHSLEDRFVKQWLRGRAGEGRDTPRHLPLRGARPEPTFRLAFSKAQTPSEKEVETNPRSRSAKLRAAIRTGAVAIEDTAADGMDLPPLTDLEARP